ncbi:(2Fe-2S) ferredoxin domain-containing protein [Stutzerimonas nosocomialis]|uniref:(2Fe-2S) ferredoxin domain-containing protein n=1 Tax=Stutzerimonas nosocomialis TaxID=1056496 RepID=UPI0011083693|nr:(2Fe-2S) ferredoxin domain-containing protein [Stutzerimonas nosocomialis]TLX55616.1 (2Fe-2S) ferredoxin domain-containing protein [Stutzerimonas nosocomialis]
MVVDNASFYSRVLFVGPDLSHGSLAELFQRQLVALRGEAALADIVDTTQGFEALWQRVAEALAADDGALLLVDMEPQSSSPYLDWLRGELARLGAPHRVFVAAQGAERDEAGLAALIALRERHLGCEAVPALADSHDWSRIPPHRYRVLLCNGPRCTRRGALALWKTLRQQLVAAGRLEGAGGVHITRTHCQFPCDLGPTLSVYPPGAWYRVPDEAAVIRLVEEQLIAGRPVPELLMEPPAG